MMLARGMLVASLALAGSAAAIAADDALDAMEAARKAYQVGDMTKAKQQLDLASQLVGQKNAEGFVAMLPEPLPGWTADKAETAAVGVAVFGATTASRRYSKGGNAEVEVRITGDSAIVMQFAQFLINPSVAGVMGKLIRVGDQRAMQTIEGSINMVVANKFLITVDGSADADAKLSYAKAVDVAKLSKM